MKLKYIEFTFGNCDTIRIDGEFIDCFVINDITPSLIKMRHNSVDKRDTAKIIAIKIFKNANKERYEFEQTQIEDYRQMTFDRFLGSSDITNIQLGLIDNNGDKTQNPYVEHYNYYVDWVDTSDYENELQKTQLSDDGDLYIVIADGKKIKDFF